MSGNMRRQPVSYRPFRVDPLMQDGLLPVSREGMGALEAKVAEGLFRMAGFFGERADRQAAREGERAGRAAASAGRPSVSIEGGGAGQISGGRETGAWLVEQLQRDLGLSPAAAAGIAGNLDHESGGFQQLQELKPLVPGSRGGFGWAQWTGPRRRAFEGWAAQQGLNPTSREANYGFLLHELKNTPEGSVLSRLRGAGSADEAARIFSDGFLRPGIPHMDSRLARARSYAPAANDAYQRMIGRGELPPPQKNVTPQVDASVQDMRIMVSGGDYRPTGRDTVYGRAYDAAGTRDYLQRLNVEIERTTEQAFELHKNNPAKLAEVFADLKESQLREHVFDEVRADYELTYDRRTGQLVMAAQRELEKKQAEENRAAFLGRTGELETVADRTIAGLDPSDPTSAQTLAALRSQLDDHYDSAVARDLITPTAAVEAKARSSRRLAVGFYEAQAKALPAEDIPALRKQMHDDYIAGKLDGVDAQGWASLESRLVGLEDVKRSDEAKAEKALAERGAKIAARVEAGFDYDPAELGRLQLDAGTAPKGEEIVSASLAMIQAAEIFRDRPLADARAHVEKMRAELGNTPSDAQISAYAYARKRLGELEEMAAKDPVAYEIATGRTRLGTIDTSTPESLGASLAQRREQMEAISQRYGSPFQFFRPDERTVLANALTENPDSFPDFVTALRETLGDRTPAALGELAEDAPTLAHTAGLAIATNDNGIAVEVARAISAKRQGLWKAKMPKTEKFVVAAGSRYAEALGLKDADRSAALGTAQLLFEADANRTGFDPDEVDKPDTPAALAWQRALDKSLGGQFVNGVHRGGLGEINGHPVVIPPGMVKDEPQILLGRITDETLVKLPPIRPRNGVPVTADVIRSAQLISERDGLYSVWLEDPYGWAPQYLAGADTGPDGRPMKWLLDMRQLEQLDLAPRAHESGRGEDWRDWRFDATPRDLP